MPLWLVILALGAAGTGFLFLKAHQVDKANTLKKVKQGHKSVKKAAKAVAKRPSFMGEREPVPSTEEVNFSKDFPSAAARDIEEVLKKEDF